MSNTVQVMPAGATFVVDDGEAILDAALRQGVHLAYGCRNGACRSCRAELIDVNVEYPPLRPEGLLADDEARGFVLLCAARALGDVVIRAELIEDADEVSTLPVRVTAKRQLAAEVLGLELQLPAGRELHFRAGQYIDVLMRDGRRRAFSIASAPQQRSLIELHVRQVPGGEFSEYAANHLKERALLRVRGPLGSFYLRKDRGLPVVLVAGGTGFAPVKSIIEDAIAEGFDQPMHLYRGVRAQCDLYLEDRIATWAEQMPGFRYTPVLSEPSAEDHWDGRTGLVHQAVLDDYPTLAGHVAYLCGPPPMVTAARAAFVTRDLDPGDIHADAFEPAHVTGHDQ